MPEIRRYKTFLYFVIVFVLLSFFEVQPTAVDLEEHRMGSATVLCMPHSVESETSAVSSPAGHLLGSMAVREQAPTRLLLIRFLVAAFAVLLFFCAEYRTAIRRFGSHMIALWQNIYYIHQIDGEKESAFHRYIMEWNKCM